MSSKPCCQVSRPWSGSGIDYVRRRILDDEKPERLATDVRGLGKRAFALLAEGLGDYAAKPPND